MVEHFPWPQTDAELEAFKRRSRDAAFLLYRQAMRQGDSETQKNLCRLAPLLFTTRKELEEHGASGGV